MDNPIEEPKRISRRRAKTDIRPPRIAKHRTSYMMSRDNYLKLSSGVEW